MTTIYDNYDISDRFDDTKQFIMDEYPELCTVEVRSADGKIHMEPDDNKVWEFMYSDDEFFWHDIWDELTNFFNNKQLFMSGSIGRWDGRHCGFKVGTFEELFNGIMKDCDYLSITDDNGHFKLMCSHHDGTNCVEFRELNDNGCKLFENWEYGDGKLADKDYSYVGKLLCNNLYSRLPHYAKHVYGC